VGQPTLLFPRAGTVPLCKIQAVTGWGPDFLMHTATGIAVFARIVEKIETDIGVNLFPVAFPSFAFSLPSFLSSISAGRICLRVGSFGDVDNKWVHTGKIFVSFCYEIVTH
jgi:hypothetical protein